MEIGQLQLSHIIGLVLGSSLISTLATVFFSRKKNRMEITKIVTSVSTEMINNLRVELERVKKKLDEIEKMEKDCVREKKILMNRADSLEENLRKRDIEREKLIQRLSDVEREYNYLLKDNKSLRRKIENLKRKIKE